MKTDIIYGSRDENTGFGQFVELFMLDEDSRIGIEWADNHQGTIFYALLKDKDDYEDFRNELVAITKDCDDIGEVYYELENYLGSEYADDFIERCDDEWGD